MDKKPNVVLMEDPEVAPDNNTGYSFTHAHIAQIKNARDIASMSRQFLVGDIQPRI